MSGWAALGGRLATGVADISDDPAVLETTGFWVVALTFEGSLTAVRMREVAPASPRPEASAWSMPPRAAWTSSLDRPGYVAAVEAIRQHIRAGDVYQVNLCRLLTTAADCPPDVAGLGAALARGNPAPYAALIDIPEAALHVASASPELFCERSGDRVRSGPIKGTAATAAGLRDKDVAENVMIVDLVRNDLARVCRPGTVTVPDLVRVESHPGLVHLVSRVEGQLDAGCGWADLIAATTPPGSVSGAPKSSALQVIGALEPVPRGLYCGALGWVDADTRTGCLAVAIRTFTWEGGRLHLGTGAGITWGSRPEQEWEETELKVARLLEVR